MPRKSSKETDIVTGTGAAARRAAAPKSRTTRTVSKVETPAPVLPTAAAAVYKPSNEEIAKLAFLYWEARGCMGGSPEEDWLRAERELSSMASAVTA